MKIKEIFDEDRFYIEKIKYENNSPQRDIIIRVDGYQYEVCFANLERILRKYDISLESELRLHHYPIERLDNRPLYRKVMDAQMRRHLPTNIDSRTKHYTTIDYNRLSRFLEDCKK
jgi:hypothetical protein